MAVNKKAILAAVYQESGIIAESVLPPDMTGFNQKLRTTNYDPEYAKRRITN